MNNEELPYKIMRWFLIGGLIVCVILFLIGAALGGSGSSSGNSAKCGSCGRTFSDSSNTRSIARTGMCSNCYSNYQWAQSVTGK